MLIALFLHNLDQWETYSGEHDYNHGGAIWVMIAAVIILLHNTIKSAGSVTCPFMICTTGHSYLFQIKYHSYYTVYGMYCIYFIWDVVIKHEEG